MLHPLIEEIADNDRAHDPWGAGMMALGAVCDVLTVTGWSSLIPASAGYVPRMGLRNVPDIGDLIVGEDDDAIVLWQAQFPALYPTTFVDDMPALTVDDLHYAARVLSRYLDVVRIAGCDY